jgi:UDP-GlcNAc:undecaprenyl-phosphate/decaprenyl-phosphate GlcNAc-1-phosphate transferase
MGSVGVAATVGAIACAVSLVATPATAWLAVRLHLVDHPGELKPQSASTPYLGGVAVGIGVLVGIITYRPVLLVPLAMALVIGTADDVRPLPPLARLGAELVTALVVAILVATRFSGFLSFLLVVLVTLVLVNGFNLIDGLDALCGSVTFAGAVGFGIVIENHGRYLAVALAGSIAGFLVFNRPPARIYLGDGGSYLIGTTMAILLATCWGPGQNLHTGIGALALVLLPAAELLFAIVRRWRAGTSLLAGDRDHPYDQLVRRGWSKTRAVALYAAVAVALSLAAVVASRSSTSIAIVIVGASALILMVLGFQAGFMATDHRHTDNGQG